MSTEKLTVFSNGITKRKSFANACSLLTYQNGAFNELGVNSGRFLLKNENNVLKLEEYAPPEAIDSITPGMLEGLSFMSSSPSAIIMTNAGGSQFTSVNVVYNDPGLYSMYFPTDQSQATVQKITPQNLFNLSYTTENYKSNLYLPFVNNDTSFTTVALPKATNKAYIVRSGLAGVSFEELKTSTALGLSYDTMESSKHYLVLAGKLEDHVVTLDKNTTGDFVLSQTSSGVTFKPIGDITEISAIKTSFESEIHSNGTPITSAVNDLLNVSKITIVGGEKYLIIGDLYVYISDPTVFDELRDPVTFTIECGGLTVYEFAIVNPITQYNRISFSYLFTSMNSFGGASGTNVFTIRSSQSVQTTILIQDSHTGPKSKIQVIRF